MDIINILIVSASVGAGHTQAAKAVRDELLRLSPAASVTLVDFLDGETSLGLIIKEAYLKMLDVFPHAYDLLYRWSQEPFPGTNVKNATALLMKARMMELVRRHRPDLILFTHPFPCCAAAYLRRSQQLTVPLAVVMTDFAVHQFWVHREVDAYFVASHEMKKQLSLQGIGEEKIFATGIPISPCFGRPLRQVTPSLTGVPTLLIMGGGLGLGAVEQAVRSLSELKTACSIVVVTGSNHKLKQRLLPLQSGFPHSLQIIGYTDRVQELMQKSTLLITKPGAITCSEALAMALPIVLYDPLPGQEEDNAAYLTRQGVAVRIDSAALLAPAIDDLLSQKGLLKSMRHQAKANSAATAATAVASFALETTGSRRSVSSVS